MDDTLTVDSLLVDLAPDELELVRMALRVLLATLGKDEADEIREIEALLARLETR